MTNASTHTRAATNSALDTAFGGGASAVRSASIHAANAESYYYSYNSYNPRARADAARRHLAWILEVIYQAL